MNNDVSFDELYKIFLLGDSGVGKSTIALQYQEERFYDNFSSTVGVDFFIKQVDMDGKKIKLQLWDSAGHERFRSLYSAYYRGGQGILLVYDTTNRESFVNLKKWLELIKSSNLQDIPRILVGNKSDLTTLKEIQFNEGREFADSIRATFFECTAKDFFSVNEVFDSLTKQIIQKNVDDKLFAQILSKKEEMEISASHLKLKSNIVNCKICSTSCEIM